MGLARPGWIGLSGAVVMCCACCHSLSWQGMLVCMGRLCFDCDVDSGGAATAADVCVCAPCRCVSILPMDVAPTAAEAVITTHALRTLAGLAAVEAARKDMEGQQQLLADIVKYVRECVGHAAQLLHYVSSAICLSVTLALCAVTVASHVEQSVLGSMLHLHQPHHGMACPCRCCSLERAPAAVDAAIVAICYLAASSKLQHMLLECGALAALVPLLLQYDVTLSPETSGRLQLPFTTTATSSAGAADGSQQQQQAISPDASGLRLLDMALVRPNMQEARSQHALLAAQALARLAGGWVGA